MTNSIEILNIPIHSIKKKDLLEQLNGVVFTPNVDHLVKLQKDREFYDIYLKADWRICDSRIIWFLSKFYKTSIAESITGVDLFIDFCNILKINNKENHKLFILGGTTDDILQKAVTNLLTGSNNPYVVGSYSPPFGFEKSEEEIIKIVDKINDSNATVLVVGVGAPKQEKFIFKIKEQVPNVKIHFAIGASIDFISGELSRAPKFINKLGFEWLYRMFNDPKRLIKRYLIDDLPIFWLVFRQKIRLYKNPFK